MVLENIILLSLILISTFIQLLCYIFCIELLTLLYNCLWPDYFHFIMLFLLLSDTLGLRLVFLRVTFQFVWLLIAGSFIYLNWAGFSTLCFDDEKRFLVCLGICKIVLLYMHVTIEEETSNEKSKEKISRKKGKHYEKKVQIKQVPMKRKKKRKKKNKEQ